MITWARAISARWRSLDPAWRYALGLFFALRIGLSLFAALLVSISDAPLDPDPILRPYQGIPPVQGGLAGLVLGPWQRFDGLWYLKIAQWGYSTSEDIHFPPLYPLLIRIVGSLLADQYFLAAILLSNLFYVLALLHLYRLASREVGPAVGRRALLYLSIFPTAFFFLAPYSEPLFLLFAVASFDHLRRGSWFWAGFWGFLATLTRLQGWVLIFPLLYEFLQQQRGRVLRKGDLLSLGLIPAAIVFYLGLRFAWGLGPLLPMEEPSLHARIVLPWENLLYSLQTLASGRFHQADLLNLGSAVLFALFIVYSWNQLPRSYHAYLISGLLFLTMRWVETQPLNSLSRYVLGLFPAFMYLGQVGQNVIWHRVIVYSSLPLLLYLTGQFVLWGWVA
ncbi:MAG: glycosyltransferase family 39 protein [Chloroflexi bacterium]|nr:glycosyltransferase family 39 protein [Chloroflexota bacterium]